MGRSRIAKADGPLILFLAALALAIAARLVTGWALPFWLDEAFTGVIASQPDFKNLLRWCLTELTGPAFYMPMWLWAKVAGLSDFALRAPPFLLSIATPLVIALRGHPDRRVRLFWATLIILWLPMLPLATEARPYPQLMLLCSVQAMAFLRFARARSARAAWLWSMVSVLAGLTHYYSLVVTSLQAVCLLWRYRRDLAALRPASLPFVVLVAWMAFHMSFVLTFAAGHAAHYDPLPWVTLLALPVFLFGEGLHGYAILVLLAFTRPEWWAKVNVRSPEALLIFCGIGSFGFLFALGMFKAILLPRYLLPVVPSLLFGLALWSNTIRNFLPVALAFGIQFLVLLATILFGPSDTRFRERRFFEFETASSWLIERNPDRLFFNWASPTGDDSVAINLAQLANFFFKRSGHPVPVTIERGMLPPVQVANRLAGEDAGAALLWISDAYSPHENPPRLDQIDTRWECRSSGSGKILIVACRSR